MEFGDEEEEEKEREKEDKKENKETEKEKRRKSKGGGEVGNLVFHFTSPATPTNIIIVRYIFTFSLYLV